MKTPYQVRTRSTLDNIEQVTSWAFETDPQHTSVSRISNPALSSAIEYFTEALGAPFNMVDPEQYISRVLLPNPALYKEGAGEMLEIMRFTFVIGPDTPERTMIWISHDSELGTSSELPSRVLGRGFPTGAIADAVTVIDELVRHLDLPLRDVVRAAGIKRSSYYSWKDLPKRRPRLDSLGQLWEMTQCVEDLIEIVPQPTSRWLMTDKRRIATLMSGRFDDLLEMAQPFASRVTSAPPFAANFAVGGDNESPKGVIESESLARKGRAVTVKSSRPPRRSNS